MGPNPPLTSAQGWQQPPSKLGVRAQPMGRPGPARRVRAVLAARGTPRPWEWWAELGKGRGQGPARPQGFKAEQGEGVRSPGLGQPLAQRGEGGAVAEGAGLEEEALGRILGPPALQPRVPSPCPTPSTCFPLPPPDFPGRPQSPKLLQGCVVTISRVSPTLYRRGCRGPQLSTSGVFLHPWGQFHSDLSLQHLTNRGPLPQGDGSQS